MLNEHHIRRDARILGLLLAALLLPVTFLALLGGWQLALLIIGLLLLTLQTAVLCWLAALLPHLAGHLARQEERLERLVSASGSPASRTPPRSE